MGNKSSKGGKQNEQGGDAEVAKTVSVVVQIVGATDLPKTDTSLTGSNQDECDPYVKLFLAADPEGKKVISNVATTPYRIDAPNVLWNSFRRLDGKIKNGSHGCYLVMKLMDKDTFKKDDKVGTAIIDLAKLKNDDLQNSEIKLVKKWQKQNVKSFLQFRVFPEDKVWPTKKTMFLIRHGESKWNESEHRIKKGTNVTGGLSTMIRGRDHHLNCSGVLDAVTLNEKWKAKDLGHSGIGPAPTSKDIETFCSAQSIYASPLTRATQTCLIALQDHKTVTTDGILLLRQLREVKNKIGWDALGKETGKGIMLRVKKCFEEELIVAEEQFKGKLTTEKIKTVCDVQVDIGDASTMWWDPDWDTKAELEERQRDLLNYLRHNDKTSMICVGHSLFFRSLCRRFIGDAMKKKFPDFAASLAKQKLANGACLMVEFDFPTNAFEDWKISNAKLMFGSTFKDEKQKKKKKELKETTK